MDSAKTRRVVRSNSKKKRKKKREKQKKKKKKKIIHPTIQPTNQTNKTESGLWTSSMYIHPVRLTILDTAPFHTDEGQRLSQWQN